MNQTVQTVYVHVFPFTTHPELRPPQSDPLRIFREDRDKILQNFMMLEGRMGYEGGLCHLCLIPGMAPFTSTEFY